MRVPNRTPQSPSVRESPGKCQRHMCGNQVLMMTILTVIDVVMALVSPIPRGVLVVSKDGAMSASSVENRLQVSGA